MTSLENQIIEYFMELKNANNKIEIMYEKLREQDIESFKKIEMMYKKLAEKEDEKNTLTIQKVQLYNDLAKRNTDYLRITRSLHIRCVCEDFERSKLIFNTGTGSTQSRWDKWNSMIDSNDPANCLIKNTLRKYDLNLNNVPRIAVDLFKKINDAVHSDFRVSQDRLLVVERYFTSDELKLVKAIIELYPITDVEYKKN
jgi:hypothetical protein